MNEFEKQQELEETKNSDVASDINAEEVVAVAEKTDEEEIRENTVDEAAVCDSDDASTPQETLELKSRMVLNICRSSYGMLYKKISKVSINCDVIKESFCRFIDDIRIKDSFSVADVIFGAEAVLKQGMPEAKPGDGIYLVEGIVGNDKWSKKLLLGTVCGILDLFCLDNGVFLDANVCDDSVINCVTKRFAVLTDKKAQKLANKLTKHGIVLKKTGSVIGSNEVVFSRGSDVLFRFPKDSLFDSEQAESISIDRTHMADFVSGYRAVCALAACNAVTKNNILRFDLSGDAASVCARALGYYSAMMYTRTVPVVITFTTGMKCDVVVPRPNVTDGDYLYLLKLRLDKDGLPDKGHHGQLFYYLQEMKKNGIIKDVLPQKENISGVIKRLCGENLEYVSLGETPDGAFGVIVSVPRGYSVNGVKMGYFKYIS